MTTPLLILQRARLLIANPDNWIKRQLTDHKGCFCAMGALCHVRDRLLNTKATSDAYNTASDLLDKVTMGRAGVNYVTYNDSPDTTHADIMSLFDEALKLAKPEPASSALPNPGTPTPTPEVVASTYMNNPTPTVTEQLQSLHFAIRSVKAAQNSLLNANAALAEVETADFSASFPNPPVPLQQALDALQKRVDDLMPKFKAGDRVRIIESQHPGNIGALLTIIEPLPGGPTGWYDAIADKPILTVACKGDKFGGMHDESDPHKTLAADVFCTRIQKVESVEDLIRDIASLSPDEVSVGCNYGFWDVKLWVDQCAVLMGSDPNLITALTLLRDRIKEASK